MKGIRHQTISSNMFFAGHLYSMFVVGIYICCALSFVITGLRLPPHAQTPKHLCQNFACSFKGGNKKG